MPVDDFVDSLERELRTRFSQASGFIDTLYLGGGTPSRLGVDGVRRALDAVRSRFPTAPGAEVTIEANPEDVSASAAMAWRDAGVTRVSLGVQSFDDAVLRWMHRTHDAAQAAKAASILKKAGFDWSLDLIFALPPEVARSWADDLRRAIDLEPPHISAYGLTVEPHTPLVRWRERGEIHEADEERYEEEFLMADRVLTAAGFDHYEISNYARSNRRAAHNAAYWCRVPYLGLGPSAHSFDGTARRWNTREYAAWRERTLTGQDPVEGSETLDTGAIAIEEAYLGLRTSSGLALNPANTSDFDRWSGHGWAVVSEGVGRLTPEGWLRLDAIIGDLTDVRSR